MERHLRYCSSVWGFCGVTELDKLQNLQNRTVRITIDTPFGSPIKPLLSNTGQELIDYAVAVMTYKFLNDLVSKNLFTRNSHCSSRALKNTQSDLKLPLKRQVVVEMDFLLGERKFRTAY